jgi:hypothetical protein
MQGMLQICRQQFNAAGGIDVTLPKEQELNSDKQKNTVGQTVKNINYP